MQIHVSPPTYRATYTRITWCTCLEHSLWAEAQESVFQQVLQIYKFINI